MILFGFSFVLLWNLAPKLFPKRWFLYLLVLFGWSLAGITVFLAIHDIWMVWKLLLLPHSLFSFLTSPPPLPPLPPPPKKKTEYLLCVRKCHKPFITIPLDQLQTAWLVVYWSSIGLCFLVFPFTISYVNAPDFGIPRKIWRFWGISFLFSSFLLFFFSSFLLFFFSSFLLFFFSSFLLFFFSFLFFSSSSF